MADGRDEERIHPRSFLVDEAEFGRNPAARWRPVGDDGDRAVVVGAYWQHLAVCTLRSMYPVRAADELAGRLGTDNVVYLRRLLTGEYRVSIEDLCLWAVALDDVSILPQFDTAKALFPPGAASGT